MLLRKQHSKGLQINLQELSNSLSSQASISNFIAQTPKQNRLTFNLKKPHNQYLGSQQQKENDFNRQNQSLKGNKTRNSKLPYKMIKSQLPAVCANHFDKQSSFFIESDQKQIIFYCQKCAILVASQGFAVKKIQSYCQQNKIIKERNNEREFGQKSLKDTATVKKNRINDFLSKQIKEKQLTSFLNILERIQAKIDISCQKNEIQIASLENSLHNQLCTLKETFENLHRVLDKYETYYTEQITKKYQSLKQVIEMMNQSIFEDIQNLDLMKQDICQAYDDIINETTNEEFQTVMRAYQQNIEQIELNQKKYQQNTTQFCNKGGKSQRSNEINDADIVCQIQSQLNKTKRTSCKSIKRRMSIAASGKIK